jgi:DNA-binding response OmpR family regulator
MAELRKKLEADPANPEYVLTARSAGYWLKQ